MNHVIYYVNISVGNQELFDIDYVSCVSGCEINYFCNNLILFKSMLLLKLTIQTNAIIIQISDYFQ